MSIRKRFTRRAASAKNLELLESVWGDDKKFPIEPGYMEPTAEVMDKLDASGWTMKFADQNCTAIYYKRVEDGVFYQIRVLNQAFQDSSVKFDLRVEAKLYSDLVDENIGTVFIKEEITFDDVDAYIDLDDSVLALIDKGLQADLEQSEKDRKAEKENIALRDELKSMDTDTLMGYIVLGDEPEKDVVEAVMNSVIVTNCPVAADVLKVLGLKLHDLMDATDVAEVKQLVIQQNSIDEMLNWLEEYRDVDVEELRTDEAKCIDTYFNEFYVEDDETAFFIEDMDTHELESCGCDESGWDTIEERMYGKLNEVVKVVLESSDRGYFIDELFNYKR